ncbi:MAG TPA: TetR family transcriptional regulator, partial [Ktedonobacteraceae bacterium]
MRRTKEEAAVTRARLLEAALESFHAKGYAATTLDDIARQAGITRGAIQWHFGSKAELYNTLVSENYEHAAEAFKEMYEAKGTPYQKLRLILVKWLGYAEEDAKFRSMLELVMLKTEVSPELAGGMQKKIQGNQASIAFFADLIRLGIESGEIRPEVHPEVAAFAALGLINGVTNLWLLDPTAFSLRGSAEETIEIFLR